MRIQSVKMEGFRSYREPSIFDFENGLTAIVGENGAGKSSIFDAVVYGLYGPGALSSNVDEYITIGATDMRVEVTLVLGMNQNLRVIRNVHLQPSGKMVPALEATLFHLEAEGLGVGPVAEEKLEGQTIDDVQKRILEYIPPLDVLQATMFIRQGDVDRLMRMTGAEQRDLVSQMIAVPRFFHEQHEVAKTVLAVLLAGHTELTVKNAATLEQANSIGQMPRGEVRKLIAADEEREQAVDDAVRKFDSAHASWLVEGVGITRINTTRRAEWGTANEDATRRWTESRDQLNAAHESDMVVWQAERAGVATKNTAISAAWQATKEEIDRENLTLQSDWIEIKDALKETDDDAFVRWTKQGDALTVSARDAVQARSNAQSAVLRYDSVREQMVALTTELASLHADDCPTCLRPLDDSTDEALGAAREEIEVKYKELYETHGTMARPDVTVFEQAEFAADKILEDHRIAVPKTSDVPPQPVVKATPPLPPTLAPSEQPTAPAIPDPPKAAPLPEMVEVPAAPTKPDAFLPNPEVARQTALTESYDRSMTLLADGNEKLSELEAELQVVRVQTAMYSPTGAPQLMIDASLGRAEEAANRWLEKFMPGYTVAFGTLSETERETFELEFQTPTGPRNWETFSGGERTVLGLAVSTGFAEIAASAHGVNFDLLVLDEADGALVGDNQEQFLRALAEIAEHRQVLMISHIAGVLEQVEQSIEIVKDGNGSRRA